MRVARAGPFPPQEWDLQRAVSREIEGGASPFADHLNSHQPAPDTQEPSGRPGQTGPPAMTRTQKARTHKHEHHSDVNRWIQAKSPQGKRAVPRVRDNPTSNERGHMSTQVPLRVAVIGLDHAHIFGQVPGLLAAGCELVGSATRDDSSDIARTFRERYPDAPVRTQEDILGDESVDVIVTAAIPADRAAISVAALRAGKDVMSDKPGCTTFEQLDELRAAVADSGRIWSVTFSERFEVPAVARAGEIARAGKIGTVIQTLGLGPHREVDRVHLAGGSGRPEWFYDAENFGGILVDIASHQIDQFLWFTGSERGEVAASTVGNFAHPDQLGMHDFGEMLLRSDTAQGYIRVDWFTPQGLPTWGDGRLFILGTKGYIEMRKYVDVEGREGTSHLFWVDDEGTHYENCADRPLTYYEDFVNDVRNRTETTCPQAHTFEVMRLALTAQRDAARRGNLS